MLKILKRSLLLNKSRQLLASILPSMTIVVIFLSNPPSTQALSILNTELVPSTLSPFIPSAGADFTTLTGATPTPGSSSPVIGNGQLALYVWEVVKPCSTAIISSIQTRVTVSGATDASGEADSSLTVAIGGQGIVPTTINSGAAFSLGFPEAVSRGELSQGAIPINGDMGATYSTSLGPGTITVHVFHDNGLTDGQITIPIVDTIWEDASCNRPPVASNDANSVHDSNNVVFTPLANDTDPDGDTLKIVKIDGQTVIVGTPITLSNGSGSVVLKADNTIEFTPSVGFSGDINITYTISDGTNLSDGIMTAKSTRQLPPNTGYVLRNNTPIKFMVSAIAVIFMLRYGAVHLHNSKSKIIKPS
jgi:hypothetical protein